MAQGTLKDALEYSAKNPTSDFARQLRVRIESGAADEEASSLGLDLSAFGRPYKQKIDMNLPTPKINPGTPTGAFEGTFERGTKEAAKAGIEQTKRGFEMINKAENPKQVIQGSLEEGAGIINTALSPIAGGVKAIAEKASENPFVQKVSQSGFADKLFGGLENAQKWAEAHPEAARDMENLFVIGSTGVAAPTAKAAGAGVKVAAETAGQVAKDAATATVKSTVGAAKDVAMGAKGAMKSPMKLLEEPIIKPYENVLKETTAEEFDRMVSVGKSATESFKNMTPMEQVGERGVRALEIVHKQLDNAGKAKQDLMNIGTVGLTPVKKDMIENFYQGLQSLKNNFSLVDSDAKLVQKVLEKAKEFRKTSTLTANRVDKFIDEIQDELYTAGRNLSIPVTDRVTGKLQSLVGKLNESLKEQLPSRYREMNKVYHDLIQVRNELNTKLGAEGERAGALMKRVFSPSDNNTKVLFQKVKDLTGIDLTNEATLARFVMDAVGDARQKSMLEQLNLPSTIGTRGAVDFLFGKLKQYADSPENMLRRAREMTKGGAPEVTKLDNLSMGLAMKKDTAHGISPENVAKNIKGDDIKLIQDYVNSPNLETFSAIQPVSEAAGVAQLDTSLQLRFWREVVEEHKNIGKGGGVIEGKPGKGSLPSEDVPMDVVDNHLISAKQVVDSMSPAELRKQGGLPSLINQTKEDIVLSLKEKFPDAAKAVERLDGDGYASIEAFERDVTKTLKELKQPRDEKGRWTTDTD